MTSTHGILEKRAIPHDGESLPSSSKKSSWNRHVVAPMEVSHHYPVSLLCSLFSRCRLEPIHDEAHLVRTLLPKPLQALVHQYLGLTDLILQFIQEGEELPDSLKKYASSAKYLDMSNSSSHERVSDLFLYFKNIESLKMVTFFDAKELIKNKHRCEIVRRSFQKLERIDISHTTETDIPFMFYFVQIRNIRHLDISHTLLKSNAINNIITLIAKNVEYLNLSYCTNVDDRTLKELKKSRSVKHLELEGCHRITSNGFTHLEELRGLQSLHLGRLSLDNDHGLSVSRCRNLTHLNLSNCTLSESSLFHIGRTEKLAHLDIHGCPIGTSGIRLLSSLTNLKTLYATSLSQEELETLMDGIPGLRVTYHQTQQNVAPSRGRLLGIAYSAADLLNRTLHRFW